MKNNYKRYGESIFIAVEEKNHFNRWYVGGLMGIGRDMQLSLFGLFLLKTVDCDHLKGMLKNFFTSVETKPASIITENIYFYQQSIFELQKEGVITSEHLFDYAIIIENAHRNTPKIKKVCS